MKRRIVGGRTIPLRSRDSPQRVLGWLAVRFPPAVQFWSNAQQEASRANAPVIITTQTGAKLKRNHPELRAQSGVWCPKEIHRVLCTLHPDTNLSSVTDGTQRRLSAEAPAKRGPADGTLGRCMPATGLGWGPRHPHAVVSLACPAFSWQEDPAGVRGTPAVSAS